MQRVGASLDLTCKEIGSSLNHHDGILSACSYMYVCVCDQTRCCHDQYVHIMQKYSLFHTLKMHPTRAWLLEIVLSRHVSTDALCYVRAHIHMNAICKQATMFMFRFQKIPHP